MPDSFEEIDRKYIEYSKTRLNISVSHVADEEARAAYHAAYNARVPEGYLIEISTAPHTGTPNLAALRPVLDVPTLTAAITRLSQGGWVKIEDINPDWLDGRPVDLAVGKSRRTNHIYCPHANLWQNPVSKRYLRGSEKPTHAMLPPTPPQEEA